MHRSRQFLRASFSRRRQVGVRGLPIAYRSVRSCAGICAAFKVNRSLPVRFAELFDSRRRVWSAGRTYLLFRCR
jgi:hypothetical protein